MIRGPGDGALDLRAVRRDDELLDSLGRRGAGDSGDPATLLLAALAVDIDHGLAELLSTPLPEATRSSVGAAPSAAAAEPDAADPDPDPVHGVGAVELVDLDAESHPTSPVRRRRRTVYGAAAALALGATFSVSGVAAAVTGDPFAPYRAVGGALSWGDDDLPPNAAQIAHLNKRLARARAAIAHGDVAGVQERIDALRAGLADLDLTDGQRAALERKLDRLEAAAARAGADADGKNVPPGKGQKGSGTKGDTATGRGDTATGRGDASTGGNAGGEKSTGGNAGGDEPGEKARGPKAEPSADPAPGNDATPTTEKPSTDGTSGSEKQTGTSAVTEDEDGAAAEDKGSGAGGKKG